MTPTPITPAELDRMPRTPGICAYCRRDTMVYALAEFTCRKCAEAGDATQNQAKETDR